MDYSELRVEMNTIRKSISAHRRKKASLEKELSDLAQERKNAGATYNAGYTQRAQQAKVNYKAKMLKPLENELSSLEDKLSSLTQKKEDDVAGVSEERMAEQYSNKNNILVEIKDSADELQSVIVEAVGERFCNELYTQLSDQTLTLNEDKLENVVNYFKLCADEIKSISSKSSKIRHVIDTLQNVITSINAEDMNQENAYLKAFVAFLCVAVFVLSFKYLYPVYAIILATIGVLNVLRNYKILKIIIIQKTIQDNVHAIEEAQHSKILESVEKEIARIENQFTKDSAHLNAEIEATKEKIRKTEMSAENSFVYDDKSVREAYELTLQQKENREGAISDELGKIEQEMKHEQQKLKELQEGVAKYVQSVQDSYLNASKMGESFEIDPKFFIDVQENKPVFFEHPLNSSLFLYDDERCIADFVKLINLQLRTKLSPQAFNVDVIDFNTIGRDYLKFKVPSINEDGKTDESKKRLFKIIASKDDWGNEVKSLLIEMNVRTQDIKVDFGDIVNYNKFMLSIDSLTMPYIFIFLKDVDVSDLMKIDVIQLLQNGAGVGIYFHAFIKQSTFTKTKDRSKELVDVIQKFFVLGESGPKPRARDWVLSLFEEEKR